LRARDRSRNVRSRRTLGPRESRRRREIADLIVHAGAVISARVIVEIALPRSAETENVITLHHRQIVAQQLVLAIPEALANALRIHVVRNQSVGTLTADFERAAQSGKLRRTVHAAPLPER